MAKLTYLQLVNRVLPRIMQSTISDVTSAAGHSLVISDLINEAQEALFNETDWYSLYTTTTFATVASTAEYAVPSDIGRTIDLIDETNNRVLIEDYSRAMDTQDPDATVTGQPETFSLQGSNYRLWPIPSSVYTIRVRYWKAPPALSANTDTSSLPIECQNCLLSYAYTGAYEYINEFERADRERQKFFNLLNKAKLDNASKLDKMWVMNSSRHARGVFESPRWPAGYPSDYA